MFSWLLRKKRTTSIVPEVRHEIVHAPAEAEASAQTTPFAAAIEAPAPERDEVVQPQAIEMVAAPATDAAPEIHVREFTVEAPEPEPPETVEPALASSPASKSPEPTPQVDEAFTALASGSAWPRRQAFTAVQPLTTRMSRPKPLLVLQGSSGEIDLRTGVAVVEHSDRQARTGSLIAVRADGRRLLANLGAGGRIRAYTLRRDGVYRLECASDARAPVLELTPDAGAGATPASRR